MVERSFLESIDDALAEKASLQSQLPEVMSSACAPGEARPIFAWISSTMRRHGCRSYCIIFYTIINIVFFLERVVKQDVMG